MIEELIGKKRILLYFFSISMTLFPDL